MKNPLCLCVFVVQTLLTGCHTTYDLSSETMRAGIDSCQDNQLDVLLYQRSDGSVMAIRCIPKPEDVTHTITIRKKASLPLINLFYDNKEIQQ